MRLDQLFVDHSANGIVRKFSIFITSCEVREAVEDVKEGTGT